MLDMLEKNFSSKVYISTPPQPRPPLGVRPCPPIYFISYGTASSEMNLCLVTFDGNEIGAKSKTFTDPHMTQEKVIHCCNRLLKSSLSVK